ncbi:hypothetical protein ICI41_32240 (plasmid) [Pseudomonas aeruginosa]|uniref:hypothetical protein n=1 Tax=Pseudomonas aeruginosa TaxID=287 RepID=UPI0013EFF90C|nr:hypothetical protein [Pseudomonas aeruginosa]QII98044.1 hypothetical protein F9C43_32230 [Pseudomonas aeruginosa]QWY10702.1 hypothetical protein ICI41_32240 [Pseudomonas aeruginosa]UZG81360.1 hypothetical protein NR803_034610 [Pseudomonas aeruginosa]WBW52436.1 hypothetical protein IGGMDNGE_00512 [Pseudomonas aeruginosa]WKA39101.1 hypothetical protein QYE79_33895 [Pseudomonas aeruginosa]
METHRDQAEEGRSMYEIGPAVTTDGRVRRTRRGTPGRRRKQDRETFDFDGCSGLSVFGVTTALAMRTGPALHYISDVLESLSDEAEVCSHVVDSLRKIPDLVPYLTEIRRRCLLRNEHTHTLLLRATFLPHSIRVRVRASTELAAKQAAHIALVSKVCRDTLEQYRE